MAWSDGITPGSPTHAIASSENPRIRVVAGPGTGKSFAMKRRVARLLESGNAPGTILPVTFTRVAAEDLHRELVGMGVLGCVQLEGVTLHSLAMKMLMRNHVLLSTGRTPQALNAFELGPLVADLMVRHGGKRQVSKRMKAYEAAWARLQQQQPGYAPTAADAAFQADLLSWLRFHGSMLIGEVIPQLYQYLKSNPAAAERFEFAHILVDEFQDLNRAEQGVIDLLSGSAHVCIVGDDDQSIYSFKHAHPEGIRDWLTVNPGADDLGLADCRRCPTRVVHMANSLIAHNNFRPAPTVLVPMPSNGDGDVRIIQYPTLQQEVEGISSIIAELVEHGIPPGDILVLAQRSVIGTPIYEALLARNVPVRSYYSEAELDTEESRRGLVLLKLLVRREDRVALRWLVGFGVNNWHAAGYRRVRERCEATGESPWVVLTQLKDGLIDLPYTAPTVEAFRLVVLELGVLESLPDLGAVIDHLLPEGVESVRDLRALALEIVEAAAPESSAELLKELSREISQPDIPLEIADVRIMSLHKSKGLSSPVTIVAGCVEGLLPRQPDATLPLEQQAHDLEEQRRLFFVGITRVKAVPAQGRPGTLILSYSQRMPVADALAAGISPAAQGYGVAHLIASRFIGELGPAQPAPVAG